MGVAAMAAEGDAATTVPVVCVTPAAVVCVAAGVVCAACLLWLLALFARSLSLPLTAEGRGGDNQTTRLWQSKGQRQ